VQSIGTKSNRRKGSQLKELKPMRKTIENNLREIDMLPQRLLAQAFNPQGNPS